MNIEIEEVAGEITVTDGDRTIRIAQDPAIGDWNVWEVSESVAGSMYVETKQGAIAFALGKIGVLDNPEFKHSKHEYT